MRFRMLVGSSQFMCLANSPLVEQITFKENTTTRMTTTKAYDKLHPVRWRVRSLPRLREEAGCLTGNPWHNRLSHGVNGLTRIASSSGKGVSPASSFEYSYNAANQRVRVDLADGTRWEYTYDLLGQVMAGRRYWLDGTPVAGQQFEYAFDDIGNRRQTGGRASSASDYTANRLNQYENRTVAGLADILGIANPTAGVTVNSVTAARQGEYFHHALSTPNSGGPWFGEVTVASQFGGQPWSSTSGKVFVPQTPENFSHDADGNLTQDGRWDYAWDGENRLVKLESRSGAPSGSRLRLEFAYDHQGRRMGKKVTNLDTSTVVVDQKFVYDGWNLIAILNPQSSILQSFVWGTDLSGTLQGAGGVGGLLWWSEYSSGQITETHYAAHDGNGNVMALVQASDWEVSARYEYGPFHELIRATGPKAKANVFLAATKFQDWESGFYYYGYRYYDPSTGRWLSRDRIEENGGVNLFGFVNNDPFSNTDPDGQWVLPIIIGGAAVLAAGCGKKTTGPGLPKLDPNCAKDPEVKNSYNRIANCNAQGDAMDEIVSVCECFAQSEKWSSAGCITLFHEWYKANCL